MHACVMYLYRHIFHVCENVLQSINLTYVYGTDTCCKSFFFFASLAFNGKRFLFQTNQIITEYISGHTVIDESNNKKMNNGEEGKKQAHTATNNHGL